MKKAAEKVQVSEKHYDIDRFEKNASQRTVDFSELEKFKETNIYLKTTMFILVTNGSGSIEINFKHYEIEKDQILLLAAGHFFKIKSVSEDIITKTLYISEEYIREMYSSDMIYKRAKYGVKMYNTPLLKLLPKEAGLLKNRMEFVGEVSNDTGHLFYKEMILKTVNIFFLDLSNIIEGKSKNEQTVTVSRDEIYFQKFLVLLASHYKEKHLVQFYAEKLSITPHYLTLIVKRLTGQTVSDFIFQLINSEAKLLLKQPMYSIQEISDLFHFSDQSAFGKFFKRKNGISPKTYRIENLNR